MSGAQRLLQIIAKGIFAVEMALFPVLFLAFILPNQVVRMGAALGLDFRAVPDFWSLRDEQLFFASHGLSSPQVIYSLHISYVFVLATIVIVFLRLISGPLLFDVIDTRAILEKKRSSILRFVLSFLFVSGGGIWALHFSSSDASGVLKALIYSSPCRYIFLQAGAFVFGVVALVEGALGCIQLFLTRKRESSPRPSLSN